MQWPLGPLDSLGVVLPNLIQMGHLVILVTLITVFCPPGGVLGRDQYCFIFFILGGNIH